MTVKSNDQITSGNVLAWVKRVKAQRAHTAVMSTITKTKEFNKIKVSRPMWKSSWRTPAQHNTSSWPACRYYGSPHPPRHCLAYDKMCVECSKVGHFHRVCRSRKTRALNELGQEIIQDNTREDFEMVSIDSEYFNKNCSILTAYLKTSVGKNSISVPYKIDMGSHGNIMPLHIFKKLFTGVTNESLAETINKHIMLKQLGTCKVMIEHKNNKKRCQFFVVPGNGQALLGMPDTDALQINNINIDSIDAEDVRNSEWYINTSTAQESNTKQELCCIWFFSKQNFRLIVDKLSLSQSWTSSGLRKNLTLLQFILMLRWPEHMLWIQSMPRMPCGYLQMPLIGMDWACPLLHVYTYPLGEIILRPRVFIRTLSQIWLRLNLPMFLLRVRLFTLM